MHLVQKVPAYIHLNICLFIYFWDIEISVEN